MYIDKIQYEENKECFKVFLIENIDSYKNQMVLMVTYKSYENFTLKKGLEIDENILEKLIYDDQYINAKTIANKYIDYKPRTCGEVRLRLKKSKYPDDVIDIIVDELKDKGFLNDLSYARQFVNYSLEYKKYSKLKIKTKMLEKKLDSSIIELILNEISQDKEEENALQVAEKRKRILNDADKSKEKIYKYLLGKGFSYPIAKKTIEKLYGEIYD